MSEVNPEKEKKGPGVVKQAGEAVKEKGKEQLKKAGKEAIKKKMAKKAGQEAVKQVASKAALAGPLGYVLFWAIIVILIIIVVVGIVMFVVTMPGMVMDKLKELGRAIGNAIASYFGADDTELSVTEEKQFAVLKYLQDMGYDLAGEGFLQTIYDDKDLASLGYSTDEAKTVKADGGIIKDKDGNIKNADSFVVYNYLVSDNYIYTISNFNMVTNDSNGFQWWDAFQALWGHVCNIFGGAGSEMWGRGLISLYLEGDSIGARGDFYVNDIFGWNDIELDAEAKTLSIRRGWGSNKMVYSLDGWTGRYGMPLEFLLSVQLATKMPDLAYDMTRAFGAGQNKGGEDEGTEVEILLHELDNVAAVSAYKAEPWGPNEYITYDTFDKLKGEGWIFTDSWTLSKEEGFNILKQGIQSPENCTYTAPTYVLESATDNGDGWIFDTNNASTLKSYGGSYDELDALNTELKDIKIVDKDEKFDYNESMIKIAKDDKKGITAADAEKREYNGTVKSKADSFGYSSANPKPIVVVDGGKEMMKGGKIAVGCGGEKKTKKEGSLEECRTHSSYGNGKEGTTNYLKYCSVKYEYYGIEKTITTRVWEYDYNGESTEFTWETYRYRVYKFTDKELKNGKTYIASFFVDYVLRYKTDAELEADGLMEDGKPVEKPVKCSDAAQEAVKGNTPETTECCENCRRLIKRIMKLLKDGNDEDFNTYTPYISKVTGHWYRDVYFTSKGNDEFIQLDEEYEAIMGERWTLYEVDEETGLYKLYKLKSDGTVGEQFNGTQQEADEQGIAVTKKAKTISFNDEADELIGWHKDGSVWSAYKQNDGSVTGAWEHLYTEEDIEEEPLKERMYIQITTQNDIAQIEEGQRTQTNKTIRDIFLNNTYFRYDGSVQTAEIIEKLRAAVFGTDEDDIHYGELSKDDLEKTATYNGKTYKVKDFSGKVELSQNSLSAFSMLENTHTLDADYIYKDFKELIVELGYFTKEELTDETPRIFAFPVPEIGSGGFPDSALDKKENEFGTQLHSKEDYDANKKNKMAAMLQSFLAAETESDNEEPQPSNEGALQPVSGIPSMKDISSLVSIGSLDGEKKPSQVSVGEFLEAAASIHSKMEGNFWEYCAAGTHSGESSRHTGDGSCPGNYATFASAEANGKTADCSSYVSWVLQEIGLMKSKQTSSGMYTMLAEYIHEKDEIGELKPGDILLSSGHVQINGEAEGDKFIQYNAGSTNAIQKKPNAYDPDFYTHVIRIPFTGSGSSSGQTFEGFVGGESVVSPVTGILLEYGTYDETIDPLTGKKSRINVDMKYNVNSQVLTEDKEEGSEPPKNDTPQTEQKDVIDKVGYAKIMILDDKTYLAIENKLKSSAKNALGSFTSLVDEDGNYYENKAVKGDILSDNASDKWTEEDIALYGYKEFAELYSDFGVSGNIIYIDGFVCESTYKSPDEKEEEKETEVDGEEPTEKDIKGTPLNKDSFTADYEGTLFEKEERYNLSSKDASNKLNNENEIKDQAPAVMRVTIDGEEKIILKEGTVIGRTMSNKELVESRGETYIAPTPNDIVVSEDPAQPAVENTNKVQGNYLRIIMRDLDDTVVENVEEYMKLDDAGSGVTSESQEYKAEANDLQILTNLLHHEGCQGYFASIAFDGNQELGAAASRATGYVVINRALANYGGHGNTITKQIMAPGQYETADKVLNGEPVTCELCMANAEWCLTYDCSSLASPDGEPMPRDIFGQSGWCQCNDGKYNCWWWIDTTGDGTQTEYTPGNSYDTFYCK